MYRLMLLLRHKRLDIIFCFRWYYTVRRFILAETMLFIFHLFACIETYQISDTKA
jgi:hypothetical protein